MTALDHHQRGDLEMADSIYREILAAAPRCFDALHLLGVAATQRGALDEGIALIHQAIALDASVADAQCNLARALLEKRDAAPAIAACDALAALQPDSADAWFLRGNALQLAERHERAIESYERALRLRPSFPAALNNQGHSLRILRRTDAALDVLGRALTLQPSYAMALNNVGLVLLDVRRVSEALRFFDQALSVAPNLLEALSNRGTALLELKRFTEAAEDFTRLGALAPGFGGAAGNLLYARSNSCQWDDYRTTLEELVAAVQRGELAATPLSFVCASDSPRAQLACAQTFTAARYPPRPLPARPLWPYPHDGIRIAYLSGDFGEHAVSYLLAGVIEHHDKRRFETIAVAWGRPNDGPTRKRLESAFDRFIDVTHVSDIEVATRLRDLEIDIAIDLTGHTSGQRTGIFAHRCAPLQVNFLGFPGSSGAPYMDYLIADSIVIPVGEEQSYSERVARLPHCYLPNDGRRPIAAEVPGRAEMGLPAKGFVFCAFNNPVKFTPEVFAIWMRLLRKIPRSVLWLRAAPAVRANLEREAQRHGIDRERLVFAATVQSIETHLARHRLADLFLDTLPYNAHATACDALWAGLPLLSCRGSSFAGRVGASLLEALGLPELITNTLQEYEERALDLSREPTRLAAIQAKLALARDTNPLFDTALYCRNLEAAYASMWERLRAGLLPAQLSIEADGREAPAGPA